MSGINIEYILHNIRKTRERSYFSQEYMAAKMHIGQNAYSKIELRKTKLTVEHLFAIADALGVEVAELLAQ
ncbi:helix-turn-helix transcriptional regulator [Mucilaginibacter mali]|uniref:Helix-turn-helix transcriptional regulator n=1 Tax=Mucilaginibacter mali TaxID=2740462 RepID=A0A7D4UE57_9SPHI|nr:helix-turn-helix transcriptional regulator [Mucilaginibacter mali]QKJ31259.1 helix-turn-helix transcriptional regulator [Mucilaginibacter mali]